MTAQTAGQPRRTRAGIAASVVVPGASTTTADLVEGVTSSLDLVVSGAQRSGAPR